MRRALWRVSNGTRPDNNNTKPFFPRERLRSAGVPPGAKLRLLVTNDRPGYVRALAAVALSYGHDHGRGCRRERPRRGDRVIEHRTTRDVMQHFRAARFHARAFPGSKDHDVEVRHSTVTVYRSPFTDRKRCTLNGKRSPVEGELSAAGSLTALDLRGIRCFEGCTDVVVSP